MKFRLYAYRRSTGEGIMKEYRKFLDGAIEANKLKKDPDIVYVTLGEITKDYSGIVTVGPKPILFTPIEEKYWN
jgi:hypothetical protein